MLSLFITHLQGYKRQAVRSPVFITLEVICELILPLIMAEIVDVAIPAGDTAYIFRLGAVMLALSLLSMAFGVLSAKYATFASRASAPTCASASLIRYRSSPSRTSTASPRPPSSPA